nr:hypothetical protein [Tanacetum cinerariifolium]
QSSSAVESLYLSRENLSSLAVGKSSGSGNSSIKLLPYLQRRLLAFCLKDLCFGFAFWFCVLPKLKTSCVLPKDLAFWFYVLPKLKTSCVLPKGLAFWFFVLPKLKTSCVLPKGTMFLNVEQLEKQLDKEDFQEIGSMAAFNTTEEKVDTSKALDASLVDKKSSGTESTEQDTSSRSGNDAHDDVNIRPIYDEEPTAEVQTTAEINVFAIGQQHIEQLEFNNEGKRLSQNDLQGSRTESRFKRAFATIFGQDIETFTGTMFLNVEQLEKQLDKEDFQEIGSMAAFNVLKIQF